MLRRRIRLQMLLDELESLLDGLRHVSAHFLFADVSPHRPAVDHVGVLADGQLVAHDLAGEAALLDLGCVVAGRQK